MDTKQDVSGMSVRDIMDKYGVCRATAYKCKDKGYIHLTDGKGRSGSSGKPRTTKPLGFGIPETTAAQIARLSANYVVGRQRIYNPNTRQWTRDTDLYQEAYQRILIELWTSGASAEALCFDIGRKAALKALKQWRSRYDSQLDDFLAWYEVDGLGGLDMDEVDNA